MAKQESKVLGQRWVVRKLYKRAGSDYFYGGVRDLDSGRTYRFSTHETEKRRAEQFVINWTRRQEKREKEAERSLSADLTFEEAYGEFLELKAPDLRRTTLADRTKTFEKVYIPYFGKMPVAEIDVADIERFLSTRKGTEKSKAAGKAVSPRTKAKNLTELRAFFDWARRRRYTERNPTEGIKVKRSSKRSGYALSVDEARALVKAAREPVTVKVKLKKDRRRKAAWTQTVPPAPRLHTAIMLGCYAGIRRRAILELRWRHVNLSRHRLEIPAEIMKADEDFHIPIHPVLEGVLRDALAEHREKLKEHRVKFDADALVIGVGEMKKSLATACKRAEIPRIGWHDLRRSFASWLATKVPYATLKALMSHAIGDVTALYVTVPWDEKVAAVATLPDLTAKATKAADASSA